MQIGGARYAGGTFLHREAPSRSDSDGRATMDQEVNVIRSTIQKMASGRL